MTQKKSQQARRRAQSAHAGRSARQPAGMATGEPAATAAHVADLRQDPRNANQGNDRGREMLEASFRKYGAARSLVTDRNGVIIGGNKSQLAAMAVGIADAIIVPTDGSRLVVVQRTDLDLEADPKAAELAVADNRTNEIGLTWNAEALQALADAGADLGHLFTEDELAEMFGGPADGKAGHTDPDAVPAPRSTTIQRGDVFQLGSHRLICGDSTSREDVGALLGEDRIDFVVTSPPYNVDIKYRTHKDKATRDEYLAFIGAVAAAFVPFLEQGRFVAWNIGVSPKTFPAHQVVTLEAMGLNFYREIVWRKQGVAYPVFPSTIRTKRIRHYKPNYTHELVHVFQGLEEHEIADVPCGLCAGSGRMAIREVPSAEAHETVQLLVNGDSEELGGEAKPDRRYQNDVWDISQAQSTVGLRTLGERSTTLSHKGKSSHAVKEHPAPFPVEVPRALMSFMAGVGEIVFDPFGGSGSTVIACEQLQRRARAIEIDPVYCQIVVDRWQDFSGGKAVQVGG